MRFKIPFTFLDVEKLKQRSRFFISKVRYKQKSVIAEYLSGCDTDLKREEYIGIALRSYFFNFIALTLIFGLILFLLSVNRLIIYSILAGFMFSSFTFFSQMVYPRVYVSRKQKNIERNLLPALENIYIQLNSGIPLFNIMVNISVADYGVLSEEFKKAVKRINAGESEPQVLNDLGKKNTSVFFRRTLWQISNGMIAGSDMSIVIKDSIKALSEEQLIQIQDYGSRLNPLIVMYMLITVIIPTLSITFLTIIASMVSLPKTMASLMFIALFVFVVFAQIMFLGLIRSRRPSLL